MDWQAYRRSSLWLVFLCCLVVCFTGQHVSAQVETEKRSFDVSEGYAINTLKEAAQQAEVEFIFSADLVKGVRTSSIQGEYLPLEAFSLMLAETSLEVFQHEQSGVYAITKVSEIKNLASENNPNQETEMKPRNNHWLKTLAAVLTLGIAATPGKIAAQEDENLDDVYDLSPFTVDASAEQGYVATQTLAGTRIASNLRDVPAQVDVMTMEFLEDVGAVSVDEAMLYSLNVENTQEYSSDPTGTDTQGVVELRGGLRVRGLGDASRTQNYFYTYFQSDTYNSSSVTLNSGPNAILYGLGSPAGIVNMDFRPAYFNNMHELRFRMDSEGSRRASILANRELIKGKLAVVVAGLYDDGRYYRKPSFDKKERIYAAAT